MKQESLLEKGKRGEEEAVQYLAGQGYTIVERNWQMRKKEIDIICRYNNYLIFVEVKARTEGYMESPLEAITLRKQKNIIDAAALFIDRFDIDQESRFDVVSVVFNPNGTVREIEHIPSAFYPRVVRIK